MLYEFYGSTELGINTVLRPEDVLRKPGSCGRAAPGVEVAVLDDEGRPVAPGTPGELHVRRYEGVFDEYWKNAEATRDAARGEWLSVGDVAWITLSATSIISMVCEIMWRAARSSSKRSTPTVGIAVVDPS